VGKLSRVSRVAAWGLGVLIAVVGLACGAVYAGFAWMTLRTLDVPLEPPPPRVTLADPAEARRFTVLLGCVSCHGRDGGGGKVGLPGVLLIGSPNLTRVLPQYSDAELARLIRFGVRRDNRTALMMPTATFYPLGDDDLARVMAYVRSLPPAPDRGPGTGVREISFQARVGFVLGKVRTAAGSVDRSRPRWGELPRTTPFERGRYLASITCSECHGVDFEGVEIQGSPTLRLVAGYDLDQFKHLLRTGEPLGKRQLGEMAAVAKEDFVSFKDSEIEDIYAFLREHFAAPAAPAP